MKFSRQLTTGFAVILMAVSMGAGAKIKGTEAAVRVDISDLDLATTQGQQVLHARVKRAAKSVCGPQDMRIAGSLQNARRNKACFDTSYSNAMTSVDMRYATAWVDVSHAR